MAVRWGQWPTLTNRTVPVSWHWRSRGLFPWFLHRECRVSYVSWAVQQVALVSALMAPSRGVLVLCPGCLLLSHWGLEKPVGWMVGWGCGTEKAGTYSTDPSVVQGCWNMSQPRGSPSDRSGSTGKRCPCRVHLLGSEYT